MVEKNDINKMFADLNVHIKNASFRVYDSCSIIGEGHEMNIKYFVVPCALLCYNIVV